MVFYYSDFRKYLVANSFSTAYGSKHADQTWWSSRYKNRLIVFFRVPGTRITWFFSQFQSSKYPTTTSVIGFRITRLPFSWDSGPRRPRPFNSVITTTSCKGPGTHKYLLLFSYLDCCFRCCCCVSGSSEPPQPGVLPHSRHIPWSPTWCSRPLRKARVQL